MSMIRTAVSGAALAILALIASCSSGDETGAEGPAAVTSVVEPASGDAVSSSAMEATDAEPAGTSTTTETPAALDAQTTSPAEPAEPCGVQIVVSFDEGAPRDRMTIANDSAAGIAITEVVFDLSSSAGQIIFDTRDGGGGVEVFQDFQVEAGEATLASEPAAVDGASSLTLDFYSFDPGQRVTFSIDVDDQLAESELGQIQVTGSEIEGAKVNFGFGAEPTSEAVFAADSTAIATAVC